MKRATVYIAGPYSDGDPVVNTRGAMVMWATLWYAGYAPICPHWTMFQHFFTPLPYEMWLEYDTRILGLCDAVLRLDGSSKGADLEVETAKGLGIPVFHSLEKLNKHFSEQESR